jgi:hypothetical protein
VVTFDCVRRLLIVVMAALFVVGCTGGDDEPASFELKRIDLPAGGHALRSKDGDLYRLTSDGNLMPLYSCASIFVPGNPSPDPVCQLTSDDGRLTTTRIDPVTLRTFDEATAQCAKYFTPGLAPPYRARVTLRRRSQTGRLA